jgi:hypothetical protein
MQNEDDAAERSLSKSLEALRQESAADLIERIESTDDQAAPGPLINRLEWGGT